MPEAAPRVRPIIEVLSVSLGMVLFALFVHRGLPWIALSALGLLIVAATIGTSLRLLPRPAELLGLAGLPRQPILYFVVGGLLRARSESVAPSMFAHAVFDFMVYGALAYAP